MQGGWGSWCRTEYTICPYLWKDKQKEYILNVYTSIGYIWKNIHKEASNPGSWGEEQGIRGERYNFHSIALVSIESSTTCTNCLPPKLMWYILISKYFKLLPTYYSRITIKKQKLSKNTRVYSLWPHSSWSLIPRRESKSPLIREARLWSHLLQSK